MVLSRAEVPDGMCLSREQVPWPPGISLLTFSLLEFFRLTVCDLDPPWGIATLFRVEDQSPLLRFVSPHFPFYEFWGNLYFFIEFGRFPPFAPLNFLNFMPFSCES